MHVHSDLVPHGIPDDVQEPLHLSLRAVGVDNTQRHQEQQGEKRGKLHLSRKPRTQELWWLVSF